MLNNSLETPQPPKEMKFSEVSFMSSGIGKSMTALTMLFIKDSNGTKGKRPFTGKVIAEQAFKILTEYTETGAYFIECRNSLDYASAYSCLVSLKSKGNSLICFLTALNKSNMLSNEFLINTKGFVKEINKQATSIYEHLKFVVSTIEPQPLDETPF